MTQALSKVATAENDTESTAVQHRSIFRIDDAGQLKVGLCFTPCGNLVAEDAMRAQEIVLETDESGALAVADSFLPQGRTHG